MPEKRAKEVAAKGNARFRHVCGPFARRVVRVLFAVGRHAQACTAAATSTFIAAFECSVAGRI